MPSHPPSRDGDVSWRTRSRARAARRGGRSRSFGASVAELLLPVLLLAAVGVAVGRSGDTTRWGALALQAEPVGWLAAAMAAYLAFVRGRLGLGLGITIGAALATSALRVPLTAPRDAPDAPEWVPLVRRCAGAVGTPRRPIKVLQWTLDSSVDASSIVSALVRAAPDVAVLTRVTDPRPLEEVRHMLGGEVLLLPEDAPTVALFTRGEFPRCGEQDRWEEHVGPNAGYSLVFAQPDEEVVFPLVVARLPSPRTARDWDAEYLATLDGVGALVERLASPSTVVVADASSTSTYQTLAGTIRRGGLRVVGVLPTWPARVGGLRVPPLHPFDRAWAGESWWGDAVTVRADQGRHSPLLVRLSPRVGVGYQRPESPTPNGEASTRRSTSTTTPPAITVPPPAASSPADR